MYVLYMPRDPSNSSFLDSVTAYYTKDTNCEAPDFVILLHNVALFVSRGIHRRYSDCLRTVRPRGRSSSPGRVKNLFFSISYRPALGPTQSPVQWLPLALCPGIKRQEREADNSPPTSAEVRKPWTYASTRSYAFMA
jgi:hypothetical protein